MREVVVRNDAGEVIGQGLLMRHGSRLPSAEPNNGPEFIVTMNNGATMHLHLPRTTPRANRMNGFGFLSILAMVGVAVALATYPLMRKLTRRLEALQAGVEHWGEGHLSARVEVNGHDEVAFLAEKFNQAAERVERLVQTHKALLANASHELRSPLTRIRMALSMGEQGFNATLQAEAQRSLQELDTLIEEILLASRLDAKEVDLGAAEAIDLTGLAAEVAAYFPVTLLPCPSHTDLWVKGTPKLLRRAIRNLLENGQRYGQSDMTLALQVDPEPTGGPWVLLSVSDQGPGVPDAHKTQIFEPFYRLPGASETSGGVGLGLALVKSIAERHGGTVWCEDAPEGGARFVLKLPLAPLG
jgi:signal transduction histidine kinase